ATIDFPDRAEWDEIVSLYQLPSAEPLLSDVAQELNEAYSIQQPLEMLLDRHRLLALCRAPLHQRLVVARKLAEADSASQFWNEDIRDLEDARCKELESEARAAAARSDDGALSQLFAEVSTGQWRRPPSPAIAQAVRNMAAQ